MSSRAITGFNSRTREGCDEIKEADNPAFNRFQFTHPGGVRLTGDFDSLWGELVSIHAPGRGATRPPPLRASPFLGFNSRTREGCDSLRGYLLPYTSMFQFTHPGGVRLQEELQQMLQSCFNSRTREGCDFSKRSTARSVSGFQFTHPGGVRRLLYHKASQGLPFQFTHPGGVRLVRWRRRSPPLPRFNSRTREGCDGRLTSRQLLEGGFNSRTREGCDTSTT